MGLTQRVTPEQQDEIKDRLLRLYSGTGKKEQLLFEAADCIGSLQFDLIDARAEVERIVAERDEETRRVIAAEQGWNDDVIELTERAEKAEAERDEMAGASAWVVQWLVAEKYRKPDVPRIVADARKKYLATIERAEKAEARIAELERALRNLRSVTAEDYRHFIDAAIQEQP